MKKTYSIMLDKKDAKKVKNFLRSMDAYFEPSQRGEFIMISVDLDEEEAECVNSFLDTL